MNLPFKAPVYRSYLESFNGIYKQGPLGFYKGNGVRCLHILLFNRMVTDLQFISEAVVPADYVTKIKSVPLAHEFLLSCTIDMILHPLHLMEARFIL